MIHWELKRRGVTLMLLWLEYLKDHPGRYQYSQFCHRYRRWAGRLTPPRSSNGSPPPPLWRTVKLRVP